MRMIATAILVLVLVGAACQRKASTDVFPPPRTGAVGIFQPYPHWNVSGRVRVIDERTLRFEDFSFKGDGLTVQLRLQQDKAMVAVLQDISRLTFDRQTFEVEIPDDVSFNDFNLVTVFSPDLGTPLSGAKFPQ